MPKVDRPTITLDADDYHRLYATWSTSDSGAPALSLGASRNESR
jgi:hypothetical protein